MRSVTISPEVYQRSFGMNTAAEIETYLHFLLGFCATRKLDALYLFLDDREHHACLRVMTYGQHERTAVEKTWSEHPPVKEPLGLLMTRQIRRWAKRRWQWSFHRQGAFRLKYQQHVAEVVVASRHPWELKLYRVGCQPPSAPSIVYPNYPLIRHAELTMQQQLHALKQAGVYDGYW